MSGQFQKEVFQIRRRHPQVRQIRAGALDFGQHRRDLLGKELDGPVAPLGRRRECSPDGPRGLGQTNHGGREMVPNQTRRLTLGDDPPMVDDCDAVAETLGLFHVMRGQDDSLAAPPHGLDQTPEVASGLRIQARGRLVEKHQIRVVDQGDRQEQTLTLTARELAGVSIQDLREIAETDQLVAIRRAPIEAREHGQ